MKSFVLKSISGAVLTLILIASPARAEPPSPNLCGGGIRGLLYVPSGSYPVGCGEVYMTNIYTCVTGQSSYVMTISQYIRYRDCVVA